MSEPIIKDKIELEEVNKLIPYPNNPKEHPDEQIDKIARSIKEYGFIQPLVIDDDNQVIIGHGRLLASKKLGLYQVPVIKSDDLSDAQKKGLRIADNRIAESSWDNELLSVELEELEEEDYDIDLLGFDDEELTELHDDNIDIEEDDFDEDAEEVETDIERGDVFELGEHRLMCGDATDEADVNKLMDSSKAHMVFTDPPYAVGIGAKNRALKNTGNQPSTTNDIIGDGEVDETAEKIWKPAFENISKILKDGGGYYITAPQGGDQMMMMMMMMMDGSIPCRHELIWVKNQPAFSMGRLDYDYKHEPILYGWRGSHRFEGNGKFTKSIWEIDRERKCYLHPTMKPIELITNAVLNSSKENDIVLDLFGGSGSTLIACEQLDRRCYMMEIDPQYCQVIIDRWEDYTDEEAIKINGD